MIGDASPGTPAVGIFAGVHGLERIGTRVVNAFLRAIVQRLRWDATLRAQLQELRLVFMPLVNPGGMLRATRANPAGVDLMRNAPLDALDAVPFLVGGQRISAGLPWYRGRAGDAMEPEGQALQDLARTELLPRPFAIALDCHSGFGLQDRLWFPFAGRRTPIPQLAELDAMYQIFEASNLHHPYVFEPQCRQYLAHGDLWDHLVLQSNADSTFLPLTLEMGSWLWVKKNPRQLFSAAGLFNPLLTHRERRVLRRHLPLFDFLMRAAASWRHWVPATVAARDKHRGQAIARWWTHPLK
jgi:hypothetical protein